MHVHLRHIRSAAALLGSAALLPAAVAAQTTLEIRVTPVVGVADAVGAVPDAPVLSSGNLLSFEDFGAMTTLGVEVDVQWGDAPIRLRMGAHHATGGDAMAQWGCPPGTGCPAVLIRVPAHLSATTASADVLWRVWRRGAVEVYPAAGLGWIRYGYGWDSGTASEFSLQSGETVSSVATGRLGLGAAYDAGPARVSAEYAESFALGDGAVGRPERLRGFRLGVGFRAF